MTMKADLRAMADAIALPDSDLHKRIESALHAAVKRVLLRDASDAMLMAGSLHSNAPSRYRAMTSALLRELEE